MMRSIAFILSVVIILQTSYPNYSSTFSNISFFVHANDFEDSEDYDSYDDDDEFSGDEEYDEVYESKFAEALKIHASKSHSVIEKALKEGGLSSEAIQIGPDGSIVGNNIDDELWQAEFALSALRKELQIVNDIGISTGFFSDDDADHGDAWSDKAVNEAMANNVIDPANNKWLRDDPELVALLDSIDDKERATEVYLDIKEEADRKALMDPAKWYLLTYWELHAYFGCARVMAGQRQVYDEVKWAAVRDYWHEFKKRDEAETPLVDGKPRTYQFTTEAFDPPTEPFQSGLKGRGLRAARDIKKGELAFKATNNTIIFTHGHTWRSLLFAYYDERGEDNDPVDADTACDLLVWSWVQTLEEDGPEVVVMDLDNGSLLNEGREDSGWDDPNVRCGHEGDTMCMMSYYSFKDIKKGEELLCDYREFAFLDSWPAMGL